MTESQQQALVIRRLARARETPASHAEHRGAAVAALQVAITGERLERKDFQIAVMAKLEHPREPCRGMEGLAPETVFPLGSGQGGDAVGDSQTLDLSRRHQRKQRPRDLRSRARRGAIAVVAVASLAPPAIRILSRDGRRSSLLLVKSS